MTGTGQGEGEAIRTSSTWRKGNVTRSQKQMLNAHSCLGGYINIKGLVLPALWSLISNMHADWNFLLVYVIGKKEGGTVGMYESSWN